MALTSSRLAILGPCLPLVSAILFASVGPVSACSGFNQTLHYFFDDFSQGTLDRLRWRTVQENWGGKRGGDDYNGGVVPENVVIAGGILSLNARGNQYSGPLRGIGSDGRRRTSGVRTGSAIETNALYDGGSFEINARILGQLGVVSAMWTYAYREESSKILNHEIDIEFPGVPVEGAPPDFSYAMLVTWTGLDPGEKTAAYFKLPRSIADGAFHRLRFDWQKPSDENDTGAVRFYIDGGFVFEARSNVPFLPAPLRIGVWFPQWWAGEPDFIEGAMEVDWVCIRPLPINERR
jgi:beta-glucanase (GH16 family)